MFKRSNTYLGIYSVIVTAAFAGLVLMGARKPGPVDFDTINVHRINLREPDGTLRMVISDQARFPGAILHGKEYPHPRAVAGMLFYNNEGTEAGGLIFSGKKGKDGKIDSSLSLTFDRYDGDQQLQLIGSDDGGKDTFAGMRINDVPDDSIADYFVARDKAASMPKDKREAFLEKLRERFHLAHRYFAGKSPTGDSIVMLDDATGMPRILLRVTPEGQASMAFVAADGKIESTLTAKGVTRIPPAKRRSVVSVLEAK